MTEREKNIEKKMQVARLFVRCIVFIGRAIKNGPEAGPSMTNLGEAEEAAATMVAMYDEIPQ